MPGMLSTADRCAQLHNCSIEIGPTPVRLGNVYSDVGAISVTCMSRRSFQYILGEQNFLLPEPYMLIVHSLDM